MPIFRYNEQPGNYYAYLIEGSGDDLNNGLTPETAVETLDRLVEILDTYAGASRRHAVIVKKRIYNEDHSVTRATGKPITFEFVGGCEIDGSGPTQFKLTYSALSISTDIVVGATIINYSSYFAQYSGGSNSRIDFFNCIVKDCTTSFISISGGTTSNRNSVYFHNSIINAITPMSYRGTLYWYNSIAVDINTVGGDVKNLVARNSIIRNCNDTFTTYDVDYCNIYETLSNQDNAYWQSQGQNLNGLSANPQFTDPTNNQYTVNQSSPCLYRGEGGEHIGIGEGFYLQANILFFQQSVINNFQLTTGRLGFIDPLDNAFIETNPIDIGQIITLESAELAAVLPVVAGEFTAGPVHYSHWYPAYSNLNTYHRGAGVTDSDILYRSKVDNNLNNTPASSATEWERLTWEGGVSHAVGKIVQYTDDKWYKANTATSTTWVAAEWDEVVMIREWNLQVKTGRTYAEAEAADWATIPYNVTPLLDVAGKGNSDDAYDPATGEVMVFRFIAIRIDAKTIV